MLIEISIARGSYQTVLVKSLSCILNQRKCLLIHFSPLTTELSLVDEATDHNVSDILGNAGCAAANATTTWQIQTVQVKCDIIIVDNGLNKSYIKLLEVSKKLTLNYNPFISQYETIFNQLTFLLT